MVMRCGVVVIVVVVVVVTVFVVVTMMVLVVGADGNELSESITIACALLTRLEGLGVGVLSQTQSRVVYLSAVSRQSGSGKKGGERSILYECRDQSVGQGQIGYSQVDRKPRKSTSHKGCDRESLILWGGLVTGAKYEHPQSDQCMGLARVKIESKRSLWPRARYPEQVRDVSISVRKERPVNNNNNNTVYIKRGITSCNEPSQLLRSGYL